MIENLTNANYLLICAKNYRNTQCLGSEEFLTDIKRLKYLKKILTRYSTNRVIDERLVLNHLIILYNVFGAEFLARLLFLKMYSQMHLLKPFLIYLNIFPNKVLSVEGRDFDTIPIMMDGKIIEKLRELDKSSKK